MKKTLPLLTVLTLAAALPARAIPPVPSDDPSSPDFMAIHCNTVPYRPCTAEEQTRKDTLNNSCSITDPNLGRFGTVSNFAEQLAANNTAVPLGSGGNQEAQGPQGYKDPAALDKAIADQREATPDKRIVKLPNGTFAVEINPGMWSTGGVCAGGGDCMTMPKPENQMISVAVMKDDADKADKKMFSGSSAGGDSAGKFAKNDAGSGPANVTPNEPVTPHPNASSTPSTGGDGANGFNEGSALANLAGGGNGDVASNGNPSNPEIKGEPDVVAVKPEEIQRQLDANPGYSFTKVGAAADKANAILGGSLSDGSVDDGGVTRTATTKDGMSVGVNK